MIPQPWVTAPDGSHVRLDDALGNNWSVLSTEAGHDPGFRILPTGSMPADACLVDRDDVLLPWLRQHRTTTVVLRPDRYVYSTDADDARTASTAT
jgi:3-(3-hydroxy-phenyl)propionate hydroxylase